MQETATGNVFGLAHLWAQGDNVSHAIAILIVLISRHQPAGKEADAPEAWGG